MGRKLGSKNKNTNTAKNKNIININVNSSKSKKGRGRPRKQSNDTTQNRQLGGMGGMAPPQVIISQPQPAPQQDNSLLSSFITSRMLNESNILNSRSNMPTMEQPTMREQPSYFNARESIIPKLPDTPLKQEMKQEIKPPAQSGPPPPPAPPRPPAPPAPPPKTNDQPKGLNLTGLKGMDAVTAELKYLASDAGKAEKARKKAEASAKKEAKKLEKEAAPQQSTAEFLNMSFTPPKRDIVEMMTPSKEPTSNAITPYKERQSIVDFLMGGTPQKTPQQLKTEKNVKRLKELKHDLSKPKQLFEYNALKTELTQQPNPNKDIAGSILTKAIKSKIARKEFKEVAAEKAIKQQKQREEASNRIKAATKTKLIKQFKEAKKELRPQNVGQPLVVNQNTKELILKKNRDRGIKAQQAAASKKRSSEQEKIINFAKFMIDQNGVNPYSGLKQTKI
jgi:hypothetical protein